MFFLKVNRTEIGVKYEQKENALSGACSFEGNREEGSEFREEDEEQIDRYRELFSERRRDDRVDRDSEEDREDDREDDQLLLSHGPILQKNDDTCEIHEESDGDAREEQQAHDHRHWDRAAHTADDEE